MFGVLGEFWGGLCGDPHDGDIHLRGLVPLRAADVVSGGGDVLCLCTASDKTNKKQKLCNVM